MEGQTRWQNGDDSTPILGTQAGWDQADEEVQRLKAGTASSGHLGTVLMAAAKASSILRWMIERRSRQSLINW
jgi:hypothetical protein